MTKMLQIKVDDQFDFEFERKGKNLSVNGEPAFIDIRQINPSTWHIIKDYKSYTVEVVSLNQAEKTAAIKVNNLTCKVSGKDEYDLLLDQLGLTHMTATRIKDLKAPMPGLVLKIFVSKGAVVKKGDNLFVLEAMKMENIIKAATDATVKSIKIKAGEKVEKGQVLIEF